MKPRDTSKDVSISPSAIKWIVSLVGGLLVALGAWFVVADRIDAYLQAPLKTHIKHDESVQSWNQYGFASNRIEYLDDKQAECEAKRMTQAKLAPVDAAICTRYEAKLKAKTAEAADLKAKAMESTKEK